MLTERQRREIGYHQGHAVHHARRAEQPVDLDVALKAEGRRWWNAYWGMYDLIRGHDLRGRTILVPGCGFGGDAICLAALGARVVAQDISPASLDIARKRAALVGAKVEFGVAAAEDSGLPARSGARTRS